MTATTSEHRKRLRKGRRVLCALASTLLACAGTPPPSLDDISTDLRIESLPDRVQVNVNGQWIGTTPAIVHLDRQQTYLIALATPGFQTRSFSGTAEALLKHRDVELVLVPNGFTGAIP